MIESLLDCSLWCYGIDRCNDDELNSHRNPYRLIKSKNLEDNESDENP